VIYDVSKDLFYFVWIDILFAVVVGVYLLVELLYNILE